MDSENVMTLIALRRGHPYAGVVPGSVAFDCERCGASVMLSPSSRAMYEADPEGVRILCVLCGLDGMQACEESPTVRVAPGAIAEIAAYFRFRSN